jgi:hypothetical protein
MNIGTDDPLSDGAGARRARAPADTDPTPEFGRAQAILAHDQPGPLRALPLPRPQQRYRWTYTCDPAAAFALSVTRISACLGSGG